MKTWFEFPEDTRFARSGRADILYTPIFFANQGVSAKFCLDNEWSKLCDDYSQFDAKVQLIGKASLGFLSIGGRPVTTLDTRYALPSVGFKPIYTLTILNLSRRVRLEEGTDNRTPFEFRLHTSTLADLQQIASSLKTVTADTASTMDLFREVSPALIVSVQYALVGTLHYNGEQKFEHDSEIRLFVSLDESQVPAMTPSLIGNNPLANLSQTVYMHLGKSKASMRGTRRRDSLPLIRRLSRSNSAASVQKSDSNGDEDSYLVVDIQNTEGFCFRTRDEAAAAKFRITLTYHSSADSETTEGSGDDNQPPPKVTASTTSLMKSLTSLTLEPVQPEGEPENPDLADDFFHLRAKIFPLKKAKLTFGEWRKTALTSAAATAAQDFMQGNNQSPTTGLLNDYRLRRASTVPTSTTIREEASTPGPAEVETSQPSPLARTATTTTSSEAQNASSTTTTTTNPLPANTTAPPTPSTNTTLAPPSLTIPTPPKRWTTTADLWLTHPLTSTLTPTFTTPYISHIYTVSITMSLNPDTSTTSSPTKAKAFKSLKSSLNPTVKSSIEFVVPVSVRYDLGLVPSYEIDRSLPEYDFSLPGYEDAVGYNPGALESLQRTDEAEQVIAIQGQEGGGNAVAVGAGGDATRRGGEGSQVIEGVAAYEARVTGARGTTMNPTTERNLDADRHAWRHANIDPSVRADVDDDDVLDMLMRNNRIRETPQGSRRVYGDGHGDGDGANNGRAETS